MMIKRLFSILAVVTILMLWAAGCSSAGPESTPAFETLALNKRPTAASTTTAVPPAAKGPDQAVIATQAATPISVQATDAVVQSTPGAVESKPRPTLQPDEWKTLPVIPTISERVLAIYQQGLALGNNPQAFSKIGDCGSTPAWFLGDFDRGAQFYRLGQYADLQAVIDHYHGSFNRTSLAARSGFNASALFAPLWSDRTYCSADEAPLACEYRNQHPSLAFIMLGTNDVWHPAEFEPQMRKIIEYSIQNGVIPVLSTKADNVEKDFGINATIARLAVEYDIPLWNFWVVSNQLPDGGLQEDRAHLTWGRNFFDDPEAMAKAWPVRNLTALQVLDAVWQKIR